MPSIMRYILPLTAILLISACGAKKKEPIFKNKIIATTNDEGKIQQIFNESTVTCEEDSCPKSVAKLTFYEKVAGEYQFAVCSGTLIRPGLILTNSHCIPESISYPGADCSKQIQVKYPGPYKGSTYGTEMVKCQRVRSVYDDDNGELDLALIEVEVSHNWNRKASFTTAEPKAGEMVHAYTMDPSSFSSNGYIRRKDCKLLEENNLFENDYSGFGRTITLGSKNGSSNSDCKIIGGNSGSGLFNNEGKLFGAIHAKVDHETMKETLLNAGFNIDSSFKPHFMGLAINLKCLGSLDRHNEEACEVTKNENYTSFIDLIEDLREKEGLTDTANSDLVVTLDKELKIGIKKKVSDEDFWGLRKFKEDYMFISYDKFIESENESENMSQSIESAKGKITL